jgi:type IV pilus assembly protein PilB
MKRKKLGEVLRERGQISSADLSKVIEEQQGKVIHLGELMLGRGLVGKADLISALMEVVHVPYVDCGTTRVEPAALKLIPRSTAERCCVLPLVREGTRLVVVMAVPQNLATLDELRFTCGKEISPRLGFRSEIIAAIEKYYGHAEAVLTAEIPEEKPAAPELSAAPEMEFISTSSRQSTLEAFQEVQAEIMQRRTPAVRLVSGIIAAAANKGASDIHIEPQAGDVAVRIRVDGVLRDLQRIPRPLQNQLVSRIKILSDMDIAERRSPQDGRIMVQMGAKKLDLRVSTLPTQYGEKVVMRLLEPDAPQVSFAELGLMPGIIDGLQQVLGLPQGMLLVTGPTGSGKSTTLYAALNALRKPAVNIVTVEDPVEYVLPGINQVHVNTKAGLTFASALRSILRQDPNVIMVGEIRDKETAEIAMKAAQTGHLVLSTLHTNDSIAAVTRLLDLGIPGYMIAASVSGIMAQRLVRKLCACHDQAEVTAEYASRLTEVGLTEPLKVQCVPVGCAECDHTGYKGRVGVYEMLLLDESVKTAVRTGARVDEIRSLARSAGMKLMQEDAVEKLRLGVTSLEEIQRVVPFEKLASPRCSGCGRELPPAFLYCPYCGSKRGGAGRPAPVARPGLIKEGALQA